MRHTQGAGLGLTICQGIVDAEYERHLPAVRAALAPLDFERAWAGGEHMTPTQAVAYALQGSETDEPLAE